MKFRVEGRSSYTVKELISALSNYPDEMTVEVAMDTRIKSFIVSVWLEGK